MKRTLKLATILSICLICVLSLCSCGEGIDSEKAKETADNFLQAISIADYDTAETYLHPEYDVDLAEFFGKFEKENNVNLKSGITITGTTGYTSSFSIIFIENPINSSKYKLSASGKADDKNILIELEVYEDGKGMGVSFLDIDVEH